MADDDNRRKVRRMCCCIVILSIFLFLALLAIAAGLVYYFLYDNEGSGSSLFGTSAVTGASQVVMPNSGEGALGKYDEKWDHIFYFTGSCNTQHGREKDDPDYYTSNSGIPHDPSSSGYMATHSTHRFLTIHEQTALLVGEGKHGVWRFQENGFIRVYRGKGRKGVPVEDKEAAIDSGLLEDKAGREDLLDTLRFNYSAIDVNVEFDYAFGEEIEKGYLNWIDLPIYHAMFEGKYEDHDPIDLPVYYCQMSSPNYPHMGLTWQLMKASPTANKVGPLGKRAGMDIRENFNDVVRLTQFPDAGIWANIGQGNPDTDKMPTNLREMKEWNQTVNYERIDLSKMDAEVYIMERAYHNSSESYLFMSFVMVDKFNDPAASEHAYIRPDGRYYEELRKRKPGAISNINTTPNYSPPVIIENETEPKEMYGLPAYGHHHMARIKHGLTGGGCPTKGGDVKGYPWGHAGSAFAVNYEEITPLCDGFLIDIKCWAELQGRPWTEKDLFIANAGRPYRGQETVTFQAHANVYGEFTDPYNEGKTNPHKVDFTEDGKIQQNPGCDTSDVPVVNWNINFGERINITEVNPDDSSQVSLRLPKRECVKDPCAP